MKRVTILFTVVFLAIFSQKMNAQTQSKSDNVLNNIQLKIKKASYDGLVKHNTSKLEEIENNIKSDKTANNHLKKYWIAYINYYKTIIAIQSKNEDLAEEHNEKGITILDNIKDKNAEDYALLALLKSLSYSFVDTMEMPKISMEIKSFLKKGFKMDKENLRLYYVQGKIDFHTPKQYGGGKITEKALKKAIELPEKNTQNTQPTWGKEQAYSTLIAYYLRENQKEKAKIYYNKALKIFPNSLIKAYQSKF